MEKNTLTAQGIHRKLQRRRLALFNNAFSWLTNKLINGWHRETDVKKPVNSANFFFKRQVFFIIDEEK